MITTAHTMLVSGGAWLYWICLPIVLPVQSIHACCCRRYLEVQSSRTDQAAKAVSQAGCLPCGQRPHAPTCAPGSPLCTACGTGIPSKLYRKGELCGACVRMWCVDSICENALGEPGSMQHATLVAVKAGAVGPCLLLL